jgi:DHA2 family multidrug resistance protein
MPSMLQGLMHYNAVTAGIVTAPSGLGTMAAMIIVGRLVGKMDLRLILAIGFGLTAVSLGWMCTYTIELSQHDIIWPGVVQGIGMGFVFVPLSAASFATLAGELRPDGTSFYSLIRNIGSSIGIAMVQAFQVANTQKAHAGLVENIGARGMPVDPAAAAGLNAEITRQASMIAYLDNFELMLILCLLSMPLLLLIKQPKKAAATQEEQEHVELAALE